MAEFTDAAGNVWSFKLTIAGAAKIRSTIVVDAADGQPKPTRLDILDTDGFVRVMTDPVAAGKVLWQLCQHQAKAPRPTSEEQFLELLDGPSFCAAREALLSEIVDFFRQDQQRKNLFVAVRMALEKAYDEMPEKMAIFAEKGIEAEIRKRLGEQSGN